MVREGQSIPPTSEDGPYRLKNKTYHLGDDKEREIGMLNMLNMFDSWKFKW